ncbi:MAG TPA: hypothetical protein VLW50_20320 [Streptosporangiaceae bacterium]|nr:hypothetical protein [Streptosporangiaceae bacterium]
MSRSEFLARTAQVYLDEQDARPVTQQIDAALRGAGADESGPEAGAVGSRRLADGRDW